VKNKFQKFEGVEAVQIKDEMRFKNAITDKMKIDETFLRVLIVHEMQVAIIII
jgi:hypothetical protein